MNKYKLNSITFSIMFILLINSTLLGILIPYLITKTKTSIIISLGISFILGFILLFIFFKLFNYLPDKNLFEKIDYAFPKPLAKLLNLVILILTFAFLSIIFFRISTFISSEFLTESPDYVVPIILVTQIIYFSCFDVGTSSRIAVISLALGLIMYLTNAFTLTQDIDLSNFKPLLNNTFNILSKSSITYILVYMSPLFLLLLIPKNNIVDNTKLTKKLTLSYIISFISSSIISIVILGVLGYNIASLYNYPSYAVLKTMNVFSFLDNLENLNILVLVLFMSYTCGYSLLFIKYLVNHLFSNKKVKKILFILLILSFVFITIMTLPYETYLTKLKIKYAYLILPISLAYLSITIIIPLVGKLKKIPHKWE